MNKATYDELALERIAKEKFGFPIDVQSIILWHADVSRTAKASVFLTNKKQLMMYLEATSPLILSDVKKIISRMGMRAELFLPPKGQPRYFEDIGKRKFREVFPGRKHVTAEVKNGEIYQFDSDAYGNWRVGARFSYRRIRTS